MKAKKRWISEEIAFLKEKYGKEDMIRLARSLRRSTYSVRHKCFRLGLKTLTAYDYKFSCKRG